MPLNKLDTILENVDRIVDHGKRDVLQLVDRNTKEVLATVRLWNWRRLNPLTKDAPTYAFTFAQTNDTKDFLPTCIIAFNGLLHDVVVRDRPDSVTHNKWQFRTKPTNERLS